MSKYRGLVFEAEQSRDVEPDALILYDRSRYENNGVITPGTDGYVQLPSGLWVYEYDGAASKVTGMVDYLAENSDFSLETWFKCPVPAGGQGVIFTTYNGATPYWHLRVHSSYSGKLRFFGDNGTGLGTWESTTTIVDDVWHHAILTINIGVNVIVYIDGEAGTSLVAGGMANIADTLHASKELVIGSHQSAGAFCL